MNIWNAQHNIHNCYMYYFIIEHYISINRNTVWWASIKLFFKSVQWKTAHSTWINVCARKICTHCPIVCLCIHMQLKSITSIYNCFFFFGFFGLALFGRSKYQRIMIFHILIKKKSRGTQILVQHIPSICEWYQKIPLQHYVWIRKYTINGHLMKNIYSSYICSWSSHTDNEWILSNYNNLAGSFSLHLTFTVSSLSALHSPYVHVEARRCERIPQIPYEFYSP